MEMTNTSPATTRAMTYVMGALAVLSCPCHLPIVIGVLSGTVAGAFLSENLALALGLSVLIFLSSATAAWRLAAKNMNR